MSACEIGLSLERGLKTYSQVVLKGMNLANWTYSFIDKCDQP